MHWPFYSPISIVSQKRMNSSNCQEIEQILRNSAYSAVLILHLFLLFFTLLSIFLLLHQYRRHSILLHPNLLILFSNMVLLYSVHTFSWLFCLLRYRILLFAYKNPCDLLTPIWMVFLIYAPYYVYSIAFPAFRFCIMVERVRATLCAEKYENEKRWMGTMMAAGIWSISIGYFLYIAGSALADGGDSFKQPQGAIFMTSTSTARPIFVVTIFTLFLMIFTAFCDWQLAAINAKIRNNSKNSPNYSLSRNYQLKENALALRMILPLDLSYALLYSLYIAFVIVIRAKKTAFSTVEYTIYFNSADTLLFLHSAVTILVYAHFVKFQSNCRRRTVQNRMGMELAKIHFKQLEMIWR